MKDSLVVGLVAVLTAASAYLPGGTQAPPLPTVDQILEKSIEASGGRAALEKITSVTSRGTISVPDAGMTGTIEIYQKAPDKRAVIVDLNGTQQREAFDGAIGWSDDPMNGLREKSGLELTEAKLGATFNIELRLKSLFRTVAVKGRERAGARDAYVIEAVPAEGSPVRLFFDVESGLAVRQQATRLSPAGPIDIDVSLDDYRTIDGVKRAFTIRQVAQSFTILIQFSEIKHNAAIDDSVFRKPGG